MEDHRELIAEARKAADDLDRDFDGEPMHDSDIMRRLCLALEEMTTERDAFHHCCRRLVETLNGKRPELLGTVALLRSLNSDLADAIKPPALVAAD
jgi:hypothetical protein